mmetsp:Transcript_53543/g.131142  ORF Transcript_53543/g.131142 Transcript_53543/m.131142 type:complete len:233 (+) Transcript_53543:346-1044(+)
MHVNIQSVVMADSATFVSCAQSFTRYISNSSVPFTMPNTSSTSAINSASGSFLNAWYTKKSVSLLTPPASVGTASAAPASMSVDGASAMSSSAPPMVGTTGMNANSGCSSEKWCVVVFCARSSVATSTWRRHAVPSTPSFLALWPPLWQPASRVKRAVSVRCSGTVFSGSVHGFENITAWWKRPRDDGATRCMPVLVAPALWPLSVTRRASPPKRAAFACTHASTACWSRMA